MRFRWYRGVWVTDIQTETRRLQVINHNSFYVKVVNEVGDTFTLSNLSVKQVFENYYKAD